jgi:hypothetical protein
LFQEYLPGGDTINMNRLVRFLALLRDDFDGVRLTALIA